jgi:hypothetical protein
MSTILSPNVHAGRIAPIRVVVVHDGETDQSSSAAEGMANWFTRSAVQASAHLCVDTDSTVRCVQDWNTAWAAPGANADGLQIELAGRASYSTPLWDDPAGELILHRAAAEIAVWCKSYSIPARWLSDAQLADGVTKGITTHKQVSRVFKQSDHTDPGDHFPGDELLGLVNARLGTTKPVKPAPVVVPSVYVPPFPGILRVGSRGAGVRELQIQLAKRGWKITVDSQFGSGTQLVVKAFQADKQLFVDGVAGPLTWRKLFTAPITK